MTAKEFKVERQLLKTLLRTERFGQKFHEVDRADSTNNKARKIADNGGDEGVVVVARTQVRGRGRFNRLWQSPEGGLWMSIILRPRGQKPAPLTILTGASIAKSLESIISMPVKFHWPNDIFVEDKKVGGILLESKFTGEELDFIIAGIGINANFPAQMLGDGLAVPATTILDEKGETIPLTSLAAGILNRFEKDYDEFLAKGPAELIRQYKSRCLTIGRRVKIINSGRIKEAEAVVKDLTDNGGLHVELSSGKNGILFNAERLILLD